MGKILIIGALGQIGSELTLQLRKERGNDQVVASDVRVPESGEILNGPFEKLDILDKDALLQLCKKHQIDEVYLLAALLSATAEKNPEFAWTLNMDGLFNVLNLAKEGLIKKVFWPSSIAVFGPGTPQDNTPQNTIMDPNTVYGISKLAGERWCEYYFLKYGVDVRSIRYPGLISYKTPPGGGTTDYAVEIFYKANKEGKYDCFLSENTRLPMMFMDDAVSGTIQLMNAEAKQILVRSSYNLSGVDFTPKELSDEIKIHMPEFQISYNSDFRQKIADSWPSSIDDAYAARDWGWQPKVSFSEMVSIMLKNC